MKNLLADGSGGWVADGRLCRSFFVFVIFHEICAKFLISAFAKYTSIYAKFKIILSQFRVSRKFDKAVSQPGVEWGGRAIRYSPGAPSTLTQIVYSSSLYIVFHSVIYGSLAALPAEAALPDLNPVKISTQLEKKLNVAWKPRYYTNIFLYSPPTPRITLLNFYSITVRSAASQTTLWHVH